jgi:type I restriction enzyme, S subunit
MSKASWRQVQLGDCGLLRNGVNFNQAQEGIGLPVIKVKDFGERVIAPSHGLDELDPSKIKIPSDQLLQVGDSVIIRSNGNGNLVGRCLYVSSVHRPTTFSGFCILFRPDRSRVDPRFISYFIRSPLCRQRLVAFGSGTGIQNLTQGMISQIIFDLPPLNEQQAISHVLGALDDRIELGRRMNHTLHATATALFRSWFVNFDPVMAKADRRQPYGMKVETAMLFPSEFEDSVIGQIPKGWKVSRLDDVLSVIETGNRPKGGVKDIVEGVPSVGAESIVSLGQFDFGKTRYVPREFYESMNRGHVVDGDVLLYKDGGRPGEFKPHVSMFGNGFPFKEFSINEHVYRLRTDPKLPQSYLYFWLESDASMDEMRNRGTGVAVPGLNSTQVRELPILIPDSEIAQHFEESVAPMIRKIFVSCNEFRTLTALRDTLLPKLLSGEIRVKQAEHIIAAT